MAWMIKYVVSQIYEACTLTYCLSIPDFRVRS